MLFRDQIKLAELARLCRRLATGLDAGLAAVNVWRREADSRGHSHKTRRHLDTLATGVAEGASVEGCFQETGDYFPALFRGLVIVGEQTGQLPEVLFRLADHYDYQLTLRKNFLSSIAWPALQFGAAIVVVGLLIFIMGIIAGMTNSAGIDVIGFGLMGFRGAVIYFTFWGVVLVGGWLTFEAARAQLTGTHFLHRLVLKIPVLGHAVRTLVLSRMAWSMNLTLDTGMPLKDAIPLCLSATGNMVYIGQADQIVENVLEGDPLSVALDEAGGYPRDFLDTLEVGEHSGRIPESMGKLSEQYQEKARRAMATLTMVAGFVVWAMVAVLLAFLIIRIAMKAYIGPMYDILNEM